LETTTTHKNLDCLLINPPFVFPKGFYFGQRTVDVPLGLISLAAFVRENGYTTQILDCNYYFKNTDAEFEQWFDSNYVKQYDSIKVIGITTTTPTINATYRLAQVLKLKYPNSIIVLGGSHASFVPDEALSRPYVDCVAIGEGEDTLLELIEGKPFEEIDGIAYKVKEAGIEKNVRNKTRTRKKKLDELPMPAYDLVDINSYRPIIGNFKRLPAMMLVSSRGCPWSCSFCRRTVGKMWTYRSAESLYNEFKYLSETYGVKDIAIMDDVFTVSKERVMEFCDLLIKKPLDILWQCFARIDIVDEEMLHTMHKAGCWGIMYGVENFDQTILNNLHKDIEVQHVFKVMEWTKSAKLESRVCMIVGNEGDTKELIYQNIELLKKLDPDLISVAILTPFPGNDVFIKAHKEDRILSYNWDVYYGSTPLVKIDSLTPVEVEKLYREMTFAYYFRLSYIFKRIARLRSWEDFRMNVLGGLGLAGFFFEKILSQFKAKGKTEARTYMQLLKEKYLPDENKEVIRALTATTTKQTVNS
jgi:anaerobic magnesium-protoporphyrin IX monomethyl ester cyclase